MLATEYIGFWTNLTGVVVPVAVYFLVLGLLNSRRRPQLLGGRQDFALLMVALGPLFVLPMVNWLGGSAYATAVVVAAAACAVLALAPQGASWVIYNIPADEARRAVGQCLRRMGVSYAETVAGFEVDSPKVRVSVGGFAPLRNVTVRLRGAGSGFSREFQASLGQSLASWPAEASPMAVGLLLVATMMLVAPLAMTAHRVPEIVRFLGDLLH